MKTLVDKEIFNIINKKLISHCSNDIDLNKYIQPASLDLPLGDEIYLIKEKFIPFNSTIKEILKDKKIEKYNINSKKTLFKGQTYLAPILKIEKNNFFFKISPKSSIGRVDLMVRSIFDNIGLYDLIFEEKTGTLWLEISPQSFNVKIKKGLPLAQIRIFKKEKNEIINNNSNVKNLKKENFLFLDKSIPIQQKLFENNKLILSLNVSNNQKITGFVAKNTNKIIDLTKTNYLDWKDFFKEIYSNNSELNLEKDKFYILNTKELISIEPKYSVEMVPFSHNIGELRVHYAGFFDPGFGYKNPSTGVLEIRPHEDLTIYDGQPICLIEIYENTSNPNKLYGESGNNYQYQQGPKLAKYFRYIN
jgi:dCTP deaminase